MSYCDTAFVLLEFAADAVPGFPAYTLPACPLGLNGDWELLEFPGVTIYCWQVVFGAPGCPGPFGLGLASAAPATKRFKAIPLTKPKIIFLDTKFTSFLINIIKHRESKSCVIF